MGVSTPLDAARGVTGDDSLDAAARLVVHWPIRLVLIAVGLIAAFVAIYLDLWWLWFAVGGLWAVSFVRDRELIVAVGDGGAVAIPKRVWSRSAGPDFVVLSGEEVGPLSGRTWQVADYRVVADRRAVAVLERVRTA